MLVSRDFTEALEQINSTLHTHPSSPQRGEHMICTVQLASKLPQLEVTLQMFSADLVTHPLRNPLLKDILVYLDRTSRYCSTVRCKRRPWLAVSGTSITPPLFRNTLGNPFQKNILSTSTETSRYCSIVRCAEIRSWVGEEGGGERGREESFDYLHTSLA